MTTAEKQKIVSIYNKMVTDGMKSYNLDMFGMGDKLGYVITEEEYDFIEPFLRFRYETEYEVGEIGSGVKFKLESSDNLSVYQTEGKVYLTPREDDYMIRLGDVLEFAMWVKKPYKAFCDAKQT